MALCGIQQVLFARLALHVKMGFISILVGQSYYKFLYFFKQPTCLACLDHCTNCDAADCFFYIIFLFKSK